MTIDYNIINNLEDFRWHYIYDIYFINNAIATNKSIVKNKNL